jgi:hypothetical protein
MNENEELINSINVIQSNFEYIAKNGKINGSLLLDLRRILNKKDKKINDLIIQKQNALDLYHAANKLLIENGIKTPNLEIDYKTA